MIYSVLLYDEAKFVFTILDHSVTQATDTFTESYLHIYLIKNPTSLGKTFNKPK